jgi:DcmR-like sensory protein
VDHFGINLTQVFDFMDNIEELPRHIVMFYEEPEHATTVALRFLKNGLQRGDRCTYDMPEKEDGKKSEDSSFLEKEMQENGVDTSYYKEKGLLFKSFYEYDIADFNSFRNRVDEIYSMLLIQFDSESKFPIWRWVGRPRANTKTNDGKVIQIQIEKFMQNDSLARRAYDKVTAICTYRLNDIADALDKQELWIKELIQCHDAVIYLPRNGNGLALRLK